MKFRTLFQINPQWAYRFIKKRLRHKIDFARARLTGRTTWEVSLEGVTVQLGFFTPYHQSIARALSEGEHEIETRRLWVRECSKPHQVIYDIGGFTGVYGILAAKANSRAQVTIFEPDPISFAHIKKNIELNNLTNCAVRQAAVTDYSGKISFLPDGTSGAKIGTDERSISVDALALDDLPPADLLKIDAEGEEHKIIRATKKALTSKPPLFLEVHRWVDDEAGLWDLLKSLGYSSQKIEGQPEVSINYVLR